MRSFIFSVLFLLLAPSLFAQKWELPKAGLVLERSDDNLRLLFRQSDTMVFNADTAFMEDGGALLVVKNGAYFGLVDPLDFTLVSDLKLKKIERFDEQGYILIEDDEGFYFVNDLMFLEDKSSEVFEDIFPLSENTSFNDGHLPYVVQKNGKFGMIDFFEGPMFYIVKPQYDEIEFDYSDDQGFFYFIRKGNKRGVGGCEGIEIDAKYDLIKVLYGECGESIFRVWKNGKCGLQQSGYKKLLIDVKYSRIEILKRYENDYIFLFEGEKLVSFYTSDGYELGEIKYPLALVEIVQNRKNFLIYSCVDGEGQIELTPEEVEGLDFGINIIYL